MLSFPLNTKLISELQIVRKLFTKMYAEVKAYSSEEQQAIHRYARISMVGASTRIENAVLTDPEVEWIDTILTQDAKVSAFDSHRFAIENKLSKDRERSIEEVAGCRMMLHLIYSQSSDMLPLSEMALRGLHYELLRYYPKAERYRGKYKTNPNSVVELDHKTNKRRDVFRTADAGPITQTAMADLITWYNEASHKEPWSIAVATEMTFRFLAVHPFQDGNGRLGRGLFLLSLLQSKDEEVSYLAPFLAIDRHIERHRSEYYMVLNQCSNGRFRNNPKDYHLSPFLEFMLKMLKLAIKDIPALRHKNQATLDLSESAATVLNCFKDAPEERLKNQGICEVTKLPKRTVSYALAQLLQKNLIQKYGKGPGTRYQLVF